MAHLGDFGEERAERQDTFGFLGETFRIHPDFSDLGMADFMLQAGDIDEEDEARAMDLVRAQLHGIVHPEDWRRFWKLCRDKRQMYVDLMILMKGLVEALSARPTQRPSDSPSGRRKTKTKSKGGSSKRERRLQRALDQGGPARVIRRLELAGRPDLAMVVEEADAQQHVS